MRQYAKSDERELARFTPLLNEFGFDIKATLEDVTSKNLPMNCFHFYQTIANYSYYISQYSAY